jgi:hypothetical protein
MPLELLTVHDLREFKKEFFHELKTLLKESSLKDKLLKSAEVRRLLRISPGTLQNLRNSNAIGFKKIGGIIYYDYNEIELMIRNNKEGATASRRNT